MKVEITVTANKHQENKQACDVVEFIDGKYDYSKLTCIWMK